MGAAMSNWKKGLILGGSILCLGIISFFFALAIWVVPVVVLALWGLFLARGKNQK